MGSAVVYHLSRRGQSVLGLEQYRIAHDLGSSHGVTRIIRLAYYEHPSYVLLLQWAYELWRELQRLAGEQLLQLLGFVGTVRREADADGNERREIDASGFERDDLLDVQLDRTIGQPRHEPLPLRAYVQGMNALLPPDVAVRSARLEPDGFDARRSARGKRYRYVIENVPTRAPLGRLQAWQLFGRLDVGAMSAAAVHLLGRHDFAAFQAADCEAGHAVREVTRRARPSTRA